MFRLRHRAHAGCEPAAKKKPRTKPNSCARRSGVRVRRRGRGLPEQLFNVARNLMGRFVQCQAAFYLNRLSHPRLRAIVPPLQYRSRRGGLWFARSIAFCEGCCPTARCWEPCVYPWITCPRTASRPVPGWLRQELRLVGARALGASSCHMGQLCRRRPRECPCGCRHYGCRPAPSPA